MSALRAYEAAVKRLEREQAREASEAAEKAHLGALTETVRLLPRWRDPLGLRWARFGRLTQRHERVGNRLWRDHPEHMNGGAELFKIQPPTSDP